MSPRIFTLALAASLASLSAASAATPSCGHLKAHPARANPKDVFRRAEWVCDMPAARSPQTSGDHGAKSRSALPR